MKKNLHLFFALLFGIVIQAQNIKFLGSTKVTLSGISQASSLNYTIPSGSNRIVIVSFDIERIHSESGGDNHITRTFTAGNSTANFDSRIFPFKIGNKTATPLNNTYSLSCQCSTATASTATLTNNYISYYLTEADGIPTGNVSFDWSGIYRGRPNAGDEMSVVVTVFENVFKTIQNHLRVIKKGGILYYAVPDKRFTFDKNRKLTTYEHLKAEYLYGSENYRYEHFLDFVTNVQNVKEEKEASKVAKKLSEEGLDTHFHVWTSETFIDHIKNL